MHQYDGFQHKVPDLKGQCDHCGAEGTAYHAFSDGTKAYLCPQHRRMMAVADAATDDLRLYVKEALMVWLEQYGDLPYVTQGLSETLVGIAAEATEDAQAMFGAQPRVTAGAAA